MSYTKAYTNKPTWHNDSAPAINETRLNDISGALDTIDDRVIAVDNKALKDVSDVNVSNLQNNQGLKWDSTSQKWVNGVVGGAVDITYANWLAQKQAGTIDNDLFYNITDYNELAGNLTPISYAEYNALTDAQKNDGTARFVYDYPLSNTYLDDTSTSSTTRGWSANKLNSEIASINNNIGNITPQLFFGNGCGKHYKTSGTNLDDIVDNAVNPTSDNDGFFTIDNSGIIGGFGNRQFIYGYVNKTKKYGWCILVSFIGMRYGKRNNATEFTIQSIGN